MHELRKIVYFDDESATDYIQVLVGGKLEKTQELLNNRDNKLSGIVGAKGSVGIDGVFKKLFGFGASVSGEVEDHASWQTSKLARSILRNTLLTDFLDVTTSKDSRVKRFDTYDLEVIEGSFSYIVMISPYLTLFKNLDINTMDYDIDISKIGDAVKMAKGYYELIGKPTVKEDDRIIFRFNINSFKNNYRLADLLKMKLTFYAVEVGVIEEKSLLMAQEIKMDENSPIDNPDFHHDSNKSKDSIEQLKVYDVLLAGVENV